jgi:hypothetical protein
VSITRVASPTATSLSITWTVSGFIDQFEVTYRYTTNRCLDTGGPVTVYINDGSVRAHTLNYLNEDSRYTITVRAINTEGSPMASVIANTSTAGKCEVKYNPAVISISVFQTMNVCYYNKRGCGN